MPFRKNGILQLRQIEHSVSLYVTLKIGRFNDHLGSPASCPRTPFADPSQHLGLFEDRREAVLKYRLDEINGSYAKSSAFFA
jgi:hypothetical protein